MESKRSDLNFREDKSWSNGWTTNMAPPATRPEVEVRVETELQVSIPPVVELPVSTPPMAEMPESVAEACESCELPVFIPPVVEMPRPMPPMMEMPRPMPPMVEMPPTMPPMVVEMPRPMPPMMEMPPSIELPEEAECGFCITPAMAYVPMQEWRDLYTAEEGFSRGTMFAELDLPFMGKGGTPND